MADNFPWAILPLKPIAEANTRLSPVLSPHQRHQLYEMMLIDVLSALSGISSIGGILGITNCSVAKKHLRSFGADILVDQDDSGLNVAIAKGLKELERREVTGAFTIPGDIPVVTSDEITGVINSIQTFGSATIVPSHDGHGTNGLAMSPLTLLSPQFGHSSKHAHIILARKMNLHLQLMPLSGYGFDIDTPADLRWMAGLTSASRTKSYLDQIDLLEAKGLSWKLVDSRLGLSG